MPIGDAYAEGGIMRYFVFCDSFDHTPPEHSVLKYWRVEGGYDAVPGPYYGDAARFRGSGNFLDYFTQPPFRNSRQDWWTRGQSSISLSVGDPSTWRLPGGPVVPAVIPLACVRYAPVVDGDFGGEWAYTVLQWVEVRADGSVALADPGGTVAASDGDVFLFRGTDAVLADPAFWAYHSLEYRIDGGASVCEVRLDGVSVVAGGVGFTAEPSHFRPGNVLEGDVGTPNRAHVWIDDFCEWHWSLGNPFPVDMPPAFGPVAVFANRPADTGTYNDLFGSGASPNANCVNDRAPDYDETYVTRIDDGQFADTYVVGPWPDVLVTAPVADAERGVLLWWMLRDEPFVDLPEGTEPTAVPFYIYQDPELGETYGSRGFGASPGYALYPLPEDGAQAVLDTLEPGLGGPLASGRFFRCSQIVLELLHTGPVLKQRRPGRAPFVIWWP